MAKPDKGCAITQSFRNKGYSKRAKNDGKKAFIKFLLTLKCSIGEVSAKVIRLKELIKEFKAR